MDESNSTPTQNTSESSETLNFRRRTTSSNKRIQNSQSTNSPRITGSVNYSDINSFKLTNFDHDLLFTPTSSDINDGYIVPFSVQKLNFRNYTNSCLRSDRIFNDYRLFIQRWLSNRNDDIPYYQLPWDFAEMANQLLLVMECSFEIYSLLLISWRSQNVRNIKSKGRSDKYASKLGQILSDNFISRDHYRPTYMLTRSDQHLVAINPARPSNHDWTNLYLTKLINCYLTPELISLCEYLFKDYIVLKESNGKNVILDTRCELDIPKIQDKNFITSTTLEQLEFLHNKILDVFNVFPPLHDLLHSLNYNDLSSKIDNLKRSRSCNEISIRYDDGSITNSLYNIPGYWPINFDEDYVIPQCVREDSILDPFVFNYDVDKSSRVRSPKEQLLVSLLVEHIENLNNYLVQFRVPTKYTALNNNYQEFIINEVYGRRKIDEQKLSDQHIILLSDNNLSLIKQKDGSGLTSAQKDEFKLIFDLYLKQIKEWATIDEPEIIEGDQNGFVSLINMIPSQVAGWMVGKTAPALQDFVKRKAIPFAVGVARSYGEAKLRDLSTKIRRRFTSGISGSSDKTGEFSDVIKDLFKMDKKIASNYKSESDFKDVVVKSREEFNFDDDIISRDDVMKYSSKYLIPIPTEVTNFGDINSVSFKLNSFMTFDLFRILRPVSNSYGILDYVEKEWVVQFGQRSLFGHISVNNIIPNKCDGVSYNQILTDFSRLQYYNITRSQDSLFTGRYFVEVKVDDDYSSDVMLTCSPLIDHNDEFNIIAEDDGATFIVRNYIELRELCKYSLIHSSFIGSPKILDTYNPPNI